MSVVQVFRRCVEAIREAKLISRTARQEKEFFFQNWFKDRLDETRLLYEQGGRNSYPDFRLVQVTEGYELKGLAYPGRDVDFDSNSQVPTGKHNGRDIYYVFGRYPKEPDGNQFPVVDLVVCHGDFLNIDSDYIHKNKNIRGFGTYGDIKIRDRKMYVVPTPFHLAIGAAHHRTLILPALHDPGPGFEEVGELDRIEAERIVVGYSFNLRTNDLIPTTIPNPNAKRVHLFKAWRLEGDPTTPVAMLHVEQPPSDEGESEDE